MTDPMLAGEAGLAGMFISAFTSATLLPGTSEGVLAALLAAGLVPVLTVVAVASAGNVLGSCVNWWLGRQAGRLAQVQPAGGAPSRLERAQAWYGRYGYWSLLASWVPVVGDPLTLVAGAMREPFWRFLAIVSLAKSARYIAVAAGVSALLPA
ncbi:YqaA family protein [Zhengella sp. ZM62]|uniref:YqaA family protein n=1 Tax=Zhengella sedimenti TaxID=3390035 RepID=UPI0039757DEC